MSPAEDDDEAAVESPDFVLPLPPPQAAKTPARANTAKYFFKTWKFLRLLIFAIKLLLLVYT